MEKLIKITILGLFLLFTGCASAPVVQPTFEEYEAANLQKKTVAITEISELGSSIEGINEIILTKLEASMLNSFNVVERKRLEPIYRERRFQEQENVQKQVEFGKILGADFIVYGSSVASFTGPATKSKSSTNKEGNFKGEIWDEVKSLAEVNIKVVDVKNGVIHSAITGYGNSAEKLNLLTFTNQEDFDRISSLKAISANASEVEDVTAKQYEERYPFGKEKESSYRKTRIIGKEYTSLDKPYEVILSRAMDKAVRSAGYQFRRKYGRLDAEVIKIVSPTEIMINIGSAFAIGPGMRVTVWDEGDPITDPRTGLPINSRVKIGTLKITQITSGLSSIAKGSKKIIRKVKVGDFVSISD